MIEQQNSQLETRAAPTAILSGGNVAVAAAAVAGVGLLAARTARASHTFAERPLTLNNIPGSGDIKILNYALSLEDLETDLYVQALLRLTSGGTNALGVRIPGLGLGRGDIEVLTLQRFGRVEREHRDFLRGVLGTAAIRPFRYDFGIQNLTRQQVLEVVLDAERTGVQAYLGAIPRFATRTYVQIAAAIQGTEARHTAVITSLTNSLINQGILSGAVRNVAPVMSNVSAPARNDIEPTGREHLAITTGAPGVFDPTVDIPASPDNVLRKISPFIVRPDAPQGTTA